MTQFFIPNYRSVSLQLCCFILATRDYPLPTKDVRKRENEPTSRTKSTANKPCTAKNYNRARASPDCRMFPMYRQDTNHTITVGHTKLVFSKIPLLTPFLKQTRERTLLANNSVVNCPCAVKTCPVSSKMLT